MTSRVLLRATQLLSGLLILYTALEFARVFDSTTNRPLTDFNAFYIAGKMYWEGTLDKAYHFESMFEAQKRLYDGSSSFMPWTYPPQFNFIAAGLALLPVGLAYLAFISVSFVSYYLVIHRLSGEYSSAVLLSIAPAIFLTIRCGQNGFLTGTLVGFFSLVFLQGRSSSAGLALGLMVIKPHLAVGITVLSLARKHWSIIFDAFLIVLVSSVLAGIAFGDHIWPAFIGGVREAAQFLQLGLYPLFRMTSIYATLRTFGASAEAALTIQCIAALSALSLIIVASMQKWAPRRIAGIAVMASLFISPYSYDYDLPILGIAVSLVIEDIDRFAGNIEKIIILGLSWAVCGWGLAQSFNEEHIDSAASFQLADQPLSIGSIALLLILTMMILIMRRSESARLADQSTNLSLPSNDQPA